MRRAALIAALCASACKAAAVAPTSVPAAAMDLSAVPERAVAGTVDGVRFALREAWFRVERRKGRARVDVILSEGRATRLCATSEPEHARHVWLRLAGVTQLAPGDLRGAPSPDDTISAHWETRASGAWQGRAGSVALRVETVSPALITGRVRACFGPGAEGCVEGSFQARACVTELDLDGPLAGNVRGPSDGDAGP